MKAAVISIFAGAAAVGSAFGMASAVRLAAHHDSHQQPTEDRWFEPATLTSRPLVARGRSLFLDGCAHCHGADARGDEGPDLHRLMVSDRYINNIITHGIKGEMPSFAKKFHSPEIQALTAYLRSLEQDEK